MPELRIEGFVIEGYVIVSADGMLANAQGVMPDELKFEGDKRFFTAALDRADLIVHGRDSFEDQPNSPLRRRIILTHKTKTLAPDPSNPKATLWNPAGAPFEAACAAAGVNHGTIAIIGGPEVFGMFLDRYDTFWLSQALRVQIPGGVGAFPGVPARSPQQILAAHGLHAGDAQILDAANDVSVTPWRR
jgi:dihydrofolate reductase